MAQRINEDIRFYLPADPYYYQVDNLPLEDLLTNDVRLQTQIDEIQSSDAGNTVGRSGFTELQPFIDAGLPGTISVRPGNFIGRTQRSSSQELAGGAAGVNAGFDGLSEMNDPPTSFGSGENPTGTYAINRFRGTKPGYPANQNVGRTAVFNFKGGSISIDKFDFDGFEDWTGITGSTPHTTPPQGRIDLVGITTMNGAMDDPWLPGNPEAPGVETGDGLPRLAVVKGAGIVTGQNLREVVIGERYVTVGEAAETLNDYGRNLEGDVVPNPEFGTVPSPDDVVNVNFARDIIANNEIAQTLSEWADSNKNANFFLPLAYVYVPQSHVGGAPIPPQYLKDIRPFFRTAELALPERQAIAASLAPSVHNPFITETHMQEAVGGDVSDLQNEIDSLLQQLTTLRSDMEKGSLTYIANPASPTSYKTMLVTLPKSGWYRADIMYFISKSTDDFGFSLGVNKGDYTRGATPTHWEYAIADINHEDSTVGSQTVVFYANGGDQYCGVIDDQSPFSTLATSNPLYAWILQPGAIFTPIDKQT